MLQFRNFTKSYHNNLVLDIPNATMADGLYWLRGKNGAGKSTLLKSIAGIISFNGEIMLDGLSIKKDGVAFRRLVNFAEAEPIYPEYLSGLEMINLFQTAKGNGVLSSQQLIAEMGMEAYVGSPLGSYSSGMLKKLSLVLAFLGKPKWILLDEPLNTLDQDSLKILYGWISHAHVEHNMNFLLSSHQQISTALLPLTHIADIVSHQLIIK